MPDKKQNDEKTKDLDSFVTKREFYAEINPIKLDISGLKADVSGLKIDVAVLKKDVSELKVDVAVLKKDVAELKVDLSEFKEETRGGFKKVRAEMSEIKNELITAMCEQTQKIIDHIDHKDRKNEREHVGMRNRISVCENKLAIQS